MKVTPIVPIAILGAEAALAVRVPAAFELSVRAVLNLYLAPPQALILHLASAGPFLSLGRSSMAARLLALLGTAVAVSTPALCVPSVQ